MAALLVGACASQEVGPTGPPAGPPTAGHAFLTIVGDRNVFIDLGARQTLTVKYHDDAGNPLAGTVAFSVEGSAQGAAISVQSAVTNSQGLATVDVVGGSVEASFGVKAEAQYADAVDWQVAVKHGSGPPQPTPLQLDGTYALESQFNVVEGLPGTVGDVVKTIIDMTDSPTDPTTFLIDLALQQINNSTVTNAVNDLRPELDATINDFLKNQLGDVYTSIIQFGNAFGDAAQRFGLKSELVITLKTDGTYEAKHTVKGIFFSTDASGTRQRTDLDLTEMGMDYVVADHIPLTRSGDTRITIGQHSLPVSYGKALVYILRNVIIQLIDPYARNMTEFLQDVIDCQSLGEQIYQAVNFGSADIYASACSTALAFAGNYLEGKLGDVGNTAYGFTIQGGAGIQDSNNDHKIDKINAGLWNGTLTIGPDAATLGNNDQTFFGTRSN